MISTHAYAGAAVRVAGVAAVGLVLAVVLGLSAPSAHAATNASSAASFIENAQTAGGGFVETRGGGANPEASLWATVALLAAGKNPADEKLNGGASAAGYLAVHLGDYQSLTDIGLLAIIQAASGGDLYGAPVQELRTDLTAAAIRADPGGAAMAAIGLLALHSGALARSTATTLEGLAQSDGGWGKPGDTDSASTALVLEAIAQSGAGNSGDAVVRAGLKYLHTAQVNDGSIAISDRTNASSSGDVASTAFTIQALQALHEPQLRTPTGTTVLQGLASYQQLSSGGLSPFGAYDTGVAPSVTQTAEAYPAFDGVAFPLPYVAPTPAPAKKAKAPVNPKATRASTGTVAQGISSSAPTPKQAAPVAAYHGASAAGSAKSHRKPSRPSGGSSVSGTVVGATAPPPKLVTRSGRPPAKDHTALYLALILLAVAFLGVAGERRRPRRGERSGPAAAVAGVNALRLAAIRRHALAPALAVVIGAGLIFTPTVTGLWGGAPKGAAMLQSFKPYMQPARIGRLSGELATLDAGFRAARPDTHAGSQLAQFERTWPATDRRFAHALATIRATRTQFDSLTSLPSLSAFPWFLLIPGLLILALGGLSLVWPATWRRARLGVLAVGIALVAMPLALGMFDAASGGERMLTAFTTVETQGNVTALQDGFGQLAIGESALSSDLSARVQHKLVAVRRVEARWIQILGDFTPTLGVMSDNVPRYQRVLQLPSFNAFPWLFAGPGIAAVLLVLLGLRTLPLPVRLRPEAKQANVHARSSA